MKTEESYSVDGVAREIYYELEEDNLVSGPAEEVIAIIKRHLENFLRSEKSVA